jgi:ABC-type Fe3+ transport system substrate-binding protein
VAKAQGLPVDFLPRPKKEMPAIDLSNSTVSILKTAPHPNAAKIAINWFLSREGQLAFQNHSEGRPGIGGNSAREDISKDRVDPQKRRAKGVDYFFVSNPKYMDASKIDQLLSEVWGRGKKG